MTHDELSADHMAQWLDEAEVHVMVNVVLVGFRGEGADTDWNPVALDEVTLRNHLLELVRGLSTDGSGGVPLTVVSSVTKLCCTACRHNK